MSAILAQYAPWLVPYWEQTISFVSAHGGAAGVTGFCMSLYTQWRLKKDKKEARSLDEFKRLRTSVDGALAKLRSLRKEVRSFGMLPDPEEIKSKIANTNKKYPDVKYELEDALRQFDKSSLVSGDNWEALSMSIDPIGDAFDRAYAPQRHTKEDLVEALTAIAKAMDELDTAIVAQLDKILK